MILKSRIRLLPAIFSFIACAFGQDVHYNYAHGTNFSSFKTYQWIELPTEPNADLPKGSALPGLPALPGGAPNFPAAPTDVRSTGSEDQLVDQDIRRAVDDQLAKRGLTKVDKNADLVVAYHAAIHEEVAVNLFGSGWGGRNYGGMWNGSIQGQSSTIPVGTLVVDLYDTARKQLIWRGDATKSIELKKDPDKNYRNLQKALTKLFKNYPPQSK